MSKTWTNVAGFLLNIQQQITLFSWRHFEEEEEDDNKKSDADDDEDDKQEESINCVSAFFNFKGVFIEYE